MSYNMSYLFIISNGLCQCSYEDNFEREIRLFVGKLVAELAFSVHIFQAVPVAQIRGGGYVFQIVVFICTIKKIKIGKDNYASCISISLDFKPKRNTAATSCCR